MSGYEHILYTVINDAEIMETEIYSINWGVKVYGETPYNVL